jgi:hypothetical protein
MKLIWKRDKADRARVQARLAKTEMDIVDMVVRLVRLEAEVGIYKPFFIDDKGPS